MKYTTHTLRELFDEALENFPYPELEATSITQGDLETADSAEIEYAEEFTFLAGRLLDDDLRAGGWIELRAEDEEVWLTAFFGVSRNGDWENGRILDEYTAIQGDYNITSKTWAFSIELY